MDERQRVSDLARRLHAEAPAGSTVAVLALAKAAGLPNTTLRRRYPDIVADLARARPAPDGARLAVSAAGDLARLQAEISNLRADLAAAVAVIQRLAVENRALRDSATHRGGARILPAQRPGPAPAGDHTRHP